MKGTHEIKELIKPTMEHLHDPYVLQLIEALSVQQDTIEEQEEIIAARIGAEHYGMYGAVCMNTGQLDAGECWLCYAKRKKREAAEMQLVAGRYQYQFEQAMKAINSIDDLFEYRYLGLGLDMLQKSVRGYLAAFTNAVKPKGK